MKKILSIFAIAILAVVAVGCYDDSEIRNTIDGYESRIASLEGSLKTLAAYQDLLSKLGSGQTVTAYSTGSDGSYTLSFSDGSSISFSAIGPQGDTGADGEPGATGATGAAGDPGADGNPGADGIVPEFRIQNQNWQVSYDNGASWSSVGSAIDQSLIISITSSAAGDAVIFTLADGSVLSVPKAQATGVVLSEYDVVMMYGGKYSISYTLLGNAVGGEVSAKLSIDAGDVYLKEEDSSHGTITIESWTEYDYGEIPDYSLAVFVDCPDGNTIMSVARIKEKMFFGIINEEEVPGTVTFTKTGSPKDIKLRYSTNDCQSWSDIQTLSGTTSFDLPAGGAIYFDGSQNSELNVHSGYFWNISANVNHSLYGALMTLVGAADGPGENMFTYLFENDEHLINASNLMLPETVAKGCYEAMFTLCKNLKYAPRLPAEELAPLCYKSMFMLCESLVSAPSLYAETLYDFCYATMFNGCRSLKSVSCYATDISAYYCVDSMLEVLAPTGVFYCAEGMAEQWRASDAGLSSEWTIQERNNGLVPIYPW